MAYENALGRSVLFGGRAGTTNFADTWEWDGIAWIARTPAVAPPARTLHAIAYDPRRSVAVLFGGEGPTTWLSDTWEWNGTTWRQVATSTTPPPRAQHAMSWFGSATIGEVVLFGGLGPTGYHAQTWGFDGVDWRLRASNGPSARVATAMAFAEGTGRTFLVGGRDAASGAALADHWAWNGSAWSPVTPTGSAPPGIAYHAMAWDAERAQLAIVGGSNGVQGSDITFFGTTTTTTVQWTASTNWNSGGTAYDPPSRIRTSCAYDHAHARLVLFGGQLLDNAGNYGPLVGTTYTRAVNAMWAARPPIATQPTGVIEAAMAYDPILGGTLLQGGGTQFTGISSRTWLFDGATWRDLGASATGPRMRHGMVHWPGFASIMFGGEAGSSNQFNDTLAWVGNDWVPMMINAAPPPTSYPLLAYDSARQRVVMHGGYRTIGGVYGQGTNETWELRSLGFAVFTWERRQTTGAPQVHHGANLAYDERRQRVVMFGGDLGWGSPSQDHYEYDGATGTWARQTPATLPPRRRGHAMAYDPARGVVIVHGGVYEWISGGFTYYDDTWEYDGVTWTERTTQTTRPATRSMHHLVHDKLRDRCVLFGGGYETDTWEYSAPLDRRAVGELGGGMDLRCRHFASAGQGAMFEFPSPSGLGWLAVYPAPVPASTHGISAPLSCASQAFFFGVNPLTVMLFGTPASYVLQLPAWAAGYGICLQGVAYDTNANCFRATDPLSMTIQHP